MKSLACLAFFTLIFDVLGFCSSAQADLILPLNAGTRVAISTKNTDLPSADIVCDQKKFSPSQLKILNALSGFSNWCNGKVIFPSQANQIKAALTATPYVLSTLDADTTTDWYVGKDTSADSALDAALPVSEGDPVTYTGSIGFLPFFEAINVQRSNGIMARPVDLIFGRTLHTLLLRKELLRRMGYKIPPIKYLHQVTVHFDSLLERDQVLKNEVPSFIGATPSRWCMASAHALKEDPKLLCKLAPSEASLPTNQDIIFNDVAVKDATDHTYNLAVSAPFDPNTFLLQPATSRSLRGAAIPLGFVSLFESVNQFTDSMMQIENENLTFQVPDIGIFSCSLDDAIWAAQKLMAISEAELKSVVVNSYFPNSVADLVYEKLKSRRNSIIDSLNNISKASTIIASSPWKDINLNISSAPDVVHGKVTSIEFPNYGSHFAFGDQPSPLEHLKYFFLSLLESNAIDSALTEINSKLPFLVNDANAKSEHNQAIQNKIQEALAKYAQTGQTQFVSLGKGPWALPTHGVEFIASRDVMAGPYMGTNNILELVDSFGYSANLGVYIGCDGLPVTTPMSAAFSARVNYTYTHIKPLTDLEQGPKEPLKTLYLPHLLKETSNIFDKSVSLGKQRPAPDTNSLQKAVVDDLNNLAQFLDIQESLIVTESIEGDENFTAQLLSVANPINVVQATLKVSGTQQFILSRLHFYRSDATHIQVFKDNGDLDNLGISLTIGFGFQPTSMPILNISTSRSSGKYNTKFFNVNIDSSLDPNSPDYNSAFFQNADALLQALKNGSTDLLNSAVPPATLAVNFLDKELNLRFLSLVHRGLKSNATMSVTNSDGSHENLISLNTGSQNGVNYQTVATDFAKYVMQRLLDKNTFGLSAMSSQNPGETYLGHSRTRHVEFQGLNTGTSIDNAFVRIKYLWEGWQMKVSDANKVIGEINKTYGYKVFPDNALADTQVLQLYDINLSLQVYKAGIDQILGWSSITEKKWIRQYAAQANCSLNGNEKSQSSSRCNTLKAFDNNFEKLQNEHLKVSDQAQAQLLLISSLEQLCSFPDFVNALGGHVYVHPEIDGFRKGSETLSIPVVGNTYGPHEAPYPDGVVTSVENILGLQDGEFYGQYLRDVL